MNALDYVVLVGTLLGIAAYGIYRTRGRRNLQTYLTGEGTTPWFVIGISVMATQASATTFLSTPGQGFDSGLGFVQNYFGAPFALILICAVFLPIYRKLKVYTAYEYLGNRFDKKTRLLGTVLFLLQRGLGAGITIYAPAIVLSTVFGWRIDFTIIATGLVVIAYTVAGGSDAVTLTQKYQLGIIFAGMLAAFVLLLAKLLSTLSPGDILAVAGGMHKLQAVDYTLDPHPRYTFWSGLVGGMFLALSYFGTDQSQVQRYIAGRSLRDSRLGLMFNAVCKIPMQFLILLLGVLLFVFYQFEAAPVFFNQTEWQRAAAQDPACHALEQQFDIAWQDKRQALERWLSARHAGHGGAEAEHEVLLANDRTQAIRMAARQALVAHNPHAQANDTDYVFITFILADLPHGLIGLLVAAFFAAALSSKAAELNALGSTTTIDVYRHIVRTDASDAHYLLASRCFTLLWGLLAILFALFANLQENLIQAGNILGSVFYGPILALFVVGFFVPRVRGTAVFWSALLSQALVLYLYYHLTISYLWYNAIGCVVCVVFSLLLEPLCRQ
ncbi:MAG TPA: sodium:solute symporter [Candidatus Xenobia bacterium]